MRNGENLQISVELMDARDKTQVWGGQYNRSGRDLMAVQREITQEISRNLSLKLSGLQQSRVGYLHTSNGEAYELYLKGLTAQDSYPKAKAAARRALEIDDGLAEAHTAMAAVLMNYDWNLPESNREFERAIELNPNYATAHHWYARET